MRLINAMFAVLLLMVGPPATARDAGFQRLLLPNTQGPALQAGIWYPTNATASAQRLRSFTQDVAPDAAVAGSNLALVVMSHGSGGWFGGHYDTALALAKAGFVAAAVTHEGDSFDDQSRRTELGIRAAQLKQLTDFMVGQWRDRAHLDPGRIGVFGFSAGGFTALVAAGGVPDPTQVLPYCRTHPATETCGHVRDDPEFSTHLAEAERASTWVHDARIKAAVVAAPALGFAFGKPGLEDIRIPVQLWRAEFDHVLPDPDYAEAVRKALPTAAEFHVVRNADHYDFLAPCPAPMALAVPEICRSRPGFDRAAFHRQFNHDIVAFFMRTLR